MSTQFFTNRGSNSLFSKFQGVLENIPNLQTFDTLVGYFRSSGYFKLRPYLENIKEIRILVGINVDNLVAKYNAKGQQYLKDPNETKEAFLKRLKNDIENAAYQKDVEEGIFQFIQDIGTRLRNCMFLG
ncbi:MAG: hypothetical protein GX801_03705 [Fibrobacter sp.]|nr:hypothetical protein [Fibrobacter sp.]